MYRAITTTLSVLLCLYSASLSANDFTLKPFKASFAVKKLGLTLGKAHFELKQTGENTWIYASKLLPSGIARMVIDATFSESSQVLLADGKIMPMRYDFKRTGDDPESASIVFNWQTHEAQVQLDGKASTRKLKDNSQDHYSLVLNLMHNAAVANKQFALWVHSKDEELYHYQIGKIEQVKTPAGAYSAYKIIQKNSHNSRELHYWLAPKLNFMPIKIEQYNKGDRTLQMVLTSQKMMIKNN